MWYFLVFLFLVNSIFFIGYIGRNLYISKKINCGFFFNLIYSLTFGVIPFLLSLLYATANIKFRLRNVIVLSYSTNEASALAITALISFLCFFLFNYLYKKEAKLNFVKRYENKKKSIRENQLIIAGLISLFIGIISLYLWTNIFGGPIKFMSMAASVRGDSDNAFGNSFAMFKQPAKLLFPSTFTFYLLFLNKSSKHRLFEFLMFCISLFYNVIFLLDTDGRLSITSFAVVMILAPFLIRKEIKKRYLLFVALIGFLAIVLIAKLDDITYYMNNGVSSDTESTSIFETIMNEFLFVYKSNINAVENNVVNVPTMWAYNDFVSGIQAWLPNSIKFSNVETVWTFNTIYSNSTATVPCDIISQGIYDFGLIGPFIFVAISSRLLRIIDKKKENSLSIYETVFFLAFIMISIRMPNYCSLYDFMLGIFPYVIFALISNFIVFICNVGVDYEKNSCVF